jgi:DNA repair ATPase RecN
MVLEIITKMKQSAQLMKEILNQDMDDVKSANHKGLLGRIEAKEKVMQGLSDLKVELNQTLAKAYQNGIDINVYRESINDLEGELVELYNLNKKLGHIILPIKDMYGKIAEEISQINGGSLYEIKA